MQTDPRLQKWCSWLQVITGDVQTLYLFRDIFNGTIDIVKSNDQIDKSSIFFGFFFNTYIDSVVMGIRRQTKANNDDSISLAKLLKEMTKNPESITRSYFYSLHHSSNPVRMINMQIGFNQFAKPDSSYIDSELVEQDLHRLKDTCKSVEAYADQRVAHWDKKTMPFDLTLEDIFKALDILGDLVKRYNLLFFATNLKIEPVTGPVFHIFKIPWLISNSLPNSEKLSTLR
jgi:AbiU2